MRKKIYIMLVAFLTAIASYGNNDKELREIIRMLNSSKDAITSDVVKFDKAEYDGHVVTLTFLVSNANFDFDGVRKNEEAFRDNTLLGYANDENDGFRELLEAVVESDAEMKIVYKGENNESFAMRISAKELKECLSNADADPLVRLKVLVDNGRLLTPMDCGNGIMMTDIFYDARYMTYVFECDELFIDIDYLEQNKNDLKVSLAELIFDSDDITIQGICDLLKELHYGVILKFVGASSGKDCTVYVEPNEIVDGFVESLDDLYVEIDDDFDIYDDLDVDLTDPLELLRTVALIANLQTPTETANGMVLTEVSLNDPYFTYVFECDESELDLDVIEENKDSFRLLIKNQFFNDENNKELCEMLKEAHYGVKFKYVGATRRKVISLYIEPDEIAENMVESEPELELVAEVVDESEELVLDPAYLLELAVILMKEEFPMDLGEGMIMTDLYIDASYLIFVIECDESEFDLDLVEDNVELMKVFIMADNADDELNGLLKEAHFGVKYKFVGSTSGKTSTVCIEPNEL